MSGIDRERFFHQHTYTNERQNMSMKQMAIVFHLLIDKWASISKVTEINTVRMLNKIDVSDCVGTEEYLFNRCTSNVETQWASWIARPTGYEAKGLYDVSAVFVAKLWECLWRVIWGWSYWQCGSLLGRNHLQHYSMYSVHAHTRRTVSRARWKFCWVEWWSTVVDHYPH